MFILIQLPSRPGFCGHTLEFVQPPFTLLRHKGVRVWNRLPANWVVANPVATFKIKLDEDRTLYCIVAT